MPGPNFVLDKAFKTTAATAAFLAVMTTSTRETVALATSATAGNIIGIAQDDVAAADVGKQATAVRVLGISQAIAGAAVAIGDKLTVNGSSRLIATTTAGNTVVGIALTAAAANGDWIDVLLTPGAKY